MPTEPQRYIRNGHHFTYGTCPLCLEPGKRLITDHCHAHGWIRGQICESCNQVFRHLERAASMTEILSAPQCHVRHRSELQRAGCETQIRRTAHLRRCPDCDALYRRDETPDQHREQEPGRPVSGQSAFH